MFSSNTRSYRIRLILLVGLLLLLTTCNSNANELNLVSSRGVRVDDAFVASYIALGGPRTLGEAITIGYSPEENGRFIQYFERGRLDQINNAIAPFPLGTWAYEGVNQNAVVQAAIPENGRSRTFANGQTVYDAFLTFYETNSGEQLLGDPISPQFQEGGVWTQYFANGRLEWHPELPVGQRVQLGLLGQAHFDDEMAATYQPRRNFIPGPAAGIQDVVIKTAVSAPILYSGDSQTLFVTVLGADESFAIPDMRLQATLNHDNGQTIIDLPLTDGDGRSQQQIDLPNLTPGQDVVIRVDVLNSSGTILGSSNLLFKTWW